jgi:hypothetical protein
MDDDTQVYGDGRRAAQAKLTVDRAQIERWLEALKDIDALHHSQEPESVDAQKAIADMGQVLEQQAQEPVFCEYCGGNDENPPDHCMDCAQPQPEQEPDAIGCQCAECGEWQRWTPSGMVCKNGHGGASGINQRLYTTPPAAPVQPVGKFAKFTNGIWREVTDGSPGVSLYTAPPQRPWVGLTEQQRNDIEDACEMIIGKPAFDATEAKLKELNHD